MKHLLTHLLLISALIICSQAGATVPNPAVNLTLAWSPSTNPVVAGYNIYFGGASGVYTNKTSVGLATSLTISNLISGNTYYFAATTQSALGTESALSSELAYNVKVPLAKLQLLAAPARQFVLTTTGPAGHTYEILATQDLKTWTVIGTAASGAGGSFNFTDTNAPNFSRRFYRTLDLTP
jgi:hypothetical protein